nr:hypothetical protein [Streptococcus anginosus]
SSHGAPGEPAPQPATQPEPASPQASPASTKASVPNAQAGPAPSEPAADLAFGAADALLVLLAHAARITPEQIGATDTT